MKSTRWAIALAAAYRKNIDHKGEFQHLSSGRLASFGEFCQEHLWLNLNRNQSEFQICTQVIHYKLAANPAEGGQAARSGWQMFAHYFR